MEGFDWWFYESSLHEGDPSPVAHTLAILEQQGHTYRSEGALWLRTTDFGDDKDRVLVRSSGEHTYFASDIAYHQDKRERGFQRQIDVWGADHHGYVPRMKAAYAALGGDPDELELLIMQFVHLVSSARARRCPSARASSSRSRSWSRRSAWTPRAGTCSRARTTRPSTSTWTWRASSPTRTPSTTCSTRTRASPRCSPRRAERCKRPSRRSARSTPTRRARRGASPTLHATERALVEALLAFPAELTEATQRRAPHRIAAYSLSLAQAFTAFYRDCQVVGVERRGRRRRRAVTESLRIALCVLSARTIARCLGLLGVSAPERM